jgi:outer membrane scaffolding protein for murein synthesis (MipA/OmpV family)
MLRASAAAALILLLPAGAWAQESDEKPRKRDILVTIGAGVQAYPRFPGSEDLRLAPLPNFSFRKAGDPIGFEAPDEGTGFALIGKKGGFQVGPAIQLQNKRKETDVGAAVGNVGFTIEAGAFVQVYLGDNLRVRAEGRRGLGGHKGWVGDLGVDLIGRPSDSTVMSIGPRVRLANRRYQRAYFGVAPPVAALTGLAPHDPDPGVRAVGIVAGLTHQFNRSWGIYAYAGYDRLVGDAGNSPIVRTFGSRSQPSGGVALTYTFKVRRGRKSD